MKISRSKLICIILLLVILLFMIVFSVIVKSKNEKEYDIYAFKIVDNDIVQINDMDIDNYEDVIELPVIVFDGMTLDELSEKIERSLANELSGYGSFIANYSLDKGVDPYLATAIMLHETGCTWGCSNLVKSCNNVGGMKGYGCGSYSYFSSLEEGIEKFIDNIYNNYYVYGLDTAYLMGSKYASDPKWSEKVSRHMEKIKNG